MSDNNYKKYIKDIEQNGYTLIPNILSKKNVKKLLDLVDLNYDIDKRRKKWKPKKINFGNGTLWKYAQTVGPAHLGAPTHPGGKNEVKVYADI